MSRIVPRQIRGHIKFLENVTSNLILQPLSKYNKIRRQNYNGVKNNKKLLRNKSEGIKSSYKIMRQNWTTVSKITKNCSTTNQKAHKVTTKCSLQLNTKTEQYNSVRSHKNQRTYKDPTECNSQLKTSTIIKEQYNYKTELYNGVKKYKELFQDKSEGIQNSYRISQQPRVSRLQSEATEVVEERTLGESLEVSNGLESISLSLCPSALDSRSLGLVHQDGIHSHNLRTKTVYEKRGSTERDEDGINFPISTE
ncbi:unnamed protein product [Xylocopa violacea]|uniref:Ribosomal protein S4 n=1 Tax=Xylocopa violacea TaxID=135666 RepID=A0ABP1N5K5_XYLVO